MAGLRRAGARAAAAGKLFRHWFTMVADCPRCGLHFEREPGYWTGAVAINTILVGGLFAIVFVDRDQCLDGPRHPVVPAAR